MSHVLTVQLYRHLVLLQAANKMQPLSERGSLRNFLLLVSLSAPVGLNYTVGHKYESI